MEQSTNRNKKRRTYLYFILPGTILYTVFVIVPIICSVCFSFFQWSGIGPMTFVGLDNFAYLLFGERMSPILMNSLKVTFKYLLAVLFFITPLQLFFAYILYLRIKFSKYIRVMLFLPYVLSTAIVGFFSILVFDGNIGMLNSLIRNTLGSSYTVAWIGDPKWMFKVFVAMIVWQCIGSGMMIFYADMQAVSIDIIEASVLDGCGDVRRFFSVILPNMRASLSSNLPLSVIYALTMFGLPYVVFGSSGGIDNTMDFIAMVFYRYAFGGTYYGTTDIGFGSSISVVLLGIILIAYLVTFRIIKWIRK
ncbi:carbohydrate ABC transporter permease [Lachnoclostridium sp. Marseille-P6806]|uniref:carbohydrate ABC transporter permease n=1 Tax=Lachnoclostridium sp. Marseille-P6806 TaxID=2364793 RepID=UPI001031DAE2|nr:sugar ABC transporter permease [Lachnoclostridium sp. Marseille-P6806]